MNLLALFLIPGALANNSWSGEGELGYTATSGNTDSESLVAKLGINKMHDQWEHHVNLEALKTYINNIRSADSFVFKEKSQYNFDEDTYGFGKLRYDNDKFSGNDYVVSISLGIGQRFINTDTHKLEASAGIGYRETRISQTQQTQGENVVNAELRYDYTISESASFSEALSTESGKDNTYSESETVLKTRINGNLASKITYLIKHNSDVPIDKEKTDTILSVSLVYSF